MLPSRFVAAVLVLAAACVLLFVDRSAALRLGALRRLQQRLGVYAAAVLLWPLLIWSLLGNAALEAPVTCGVALLVLLYLSFEVTVVSCYAGPLVEYDSVDSVYERGVQVSTVAFAVATLLLSQKDAALAGLVAGPVFVGLLFCTASALPSAVARKRVGASGRWAAFQKVAVSFAAGLLCVAVARCVDELQRTDRLAVPLSEKRTLTEQT